MTCETWGIRPSEALELNEDPFTAYCFDEAIAYVKRLYESKGSNESPQTRDTKDQRPKSALAFMTQDKFKVK